MNILDSLVVEIVYEFHFLRKRLRKLQGHNLKPTSHHNIVNMDGLRPSVTAELSFVLY